MKIWKIYTQCCKNPHPIKEITEQQFNSLVEDLITDLTNINDYPEFFPDEDDDKKTDLFYSALYELITETWNLYGILECGDFCLKKTDNDEWPSRPSMGGYENFSNSEIKKRIEKIAAKAIL